MRNPLPPEKLYGKRIARARGERTRTELAELVGVTLATWSRWENGDFPPTDDKRPLIAQTLGVDAAALFDPSRRDDDPEVEVAA
jgi:transcriptional regulator with XRE-family HTH domain